MSPSAETEAWALFNDVETDSDSSSSSSSSSSEIDAYTPKRDAVNGVLAFHAGVEERLLQFVYRTKQKSKNPKVTLSAVDRFCYEHHWMMHIGDIKGKILQDALESAPKPIRAVELGSYCGYSAVLMSSKFNTGEDTLLSLDVEPKCIEWSRRLASHAGVDDGRVEFQLIPKTETIFSILSKKMKKEVLQSTESTNTTNTTNITNSTTPKSNDVNIDQPSSKYTPFITVLFIDHKKSRYFLEPLLVPGCVVIADNVSSFDGGVSLQEYINYVRNPEGKYISSTSHKSFVEYSKEELKQWPDSVEVSVFR